MRSICCNIILQRMPSKASIKAIGYTVLAATRKEPKDDFERDSGFDKALEDKVLHNHHLHNRPPRYDSETASAYYPQQSAPQNPATHQTDWSSPQFQRQPLMHTTSMPVNASYTQNRDGYGRATGQQHFSPQPYSSPPPSGHSGHSVPFPDHGGYSAHQHPPADFNPSLPEPRSYSQPGYPDQQYSDAYGRPQAQPNPSGANQDRYTYSYPNNSTSPQHYQSPPSNQPQHYNQYSQPPARRTTSDGTYNDMQAQQHNPWQAR